MSLRPITELLDEWVEAQAPIDPEDLFDWDAFIESFETEEAR